MKKKLKKISKHKECPMLDQFKKIDKVALFTKFDLFYMSNFHFLKKKEVHIKCETPWLY